MDRKTAITTAAAAAATLLAGSAAIAANVGILGGQDDPAIGELSPVAFETESPTTDATTSDTQLETVYVDEVIRVPSGSVGSSTDGTGLGTAPTANPETAPGVADGTYDDDDTYADDAYDDGTYEDDDEHHDEDEDEHEDEDHDEDDDEHGEYEGGEDDD